MNSKTKYLLKNTYLYTISTISIRLIAFIMVPFYTSILTKEDYGTIDLIFTSINLLLPICTLSINHAVLRFTLEKDSDKKLIFSYALFVVFIGMVIVTGISNLIKSSTMFNAYRVLLLVLLFTNIIYIIISELTRGLEKIKVFVFGNILMVFISTILNIFTIAFLEYGIKGYIISYSIGYLFGILYYFFRIKAYKYITFGIFNRSSIIVFNQMLKYSLFLIPNSLFWWITNASDRYIILWNLGAEANAIYAVANKLPVIITSVMSIFIQAWFLSIVKEEKSSDRKKYYEVMFGNMVNFVFIVMSFLLVILKLFLKIYVSEHYYTAWQSGTFLLLSAGFNVLAAFIGNNYTVVKKNLGNMISTLFGALINIILNFILIPKLGLIGASFATYISYLLVVIYRIIDTKKFNERPYRFFEFKINNLISWILIQVQVFIIFRTDKLISIYNVIIFIIILIIIKNFIVNIINLLQYYFNKLKEFKYKTRGE